MEVLGAIVPLTAKLNAIPVTGSAQNGAAPESSQIKLIGINLTEDYRLS
jgi:hypothetical protein